MRLRRRVTDIAFCAKALAVVMAVVGVVVCIVSPAVGASVILCCFVPGGLGFALTDAANQEEPIVFHPELDAGDRYQ